MEHFRDKHLIILIFSFEFELSMQNVVEEFIPVFGNIVHNWISS